MKKWSYLQFNKYIAECYFDDDFVEKLEDKKLKEQFTEELHELIYKYIFQIGGLSKVDKLDKDSIEAKAREIFERDYSGVGDWQGFADGFEEGYKAILTDLHKV